MKDVKDAVARQRTSDDPCTLYGFEFAVREKANGVDRGAFALRVTAERDDRKKPKVKPRDDRFIARTYTSVVLSDDPSIRPGRRARPQVDAVRFAGPGQWNGLPGYRFEAFAQDRGEPGRHHDSLTVPVYDGAGHIVAQFDGEPDGGNVQSARLQR